MHKFLPTHWGGASFRKDMSTVPASLRAQALEPWIPILAMTATLKVSEFEEVVDMLCIDDSKLVKITSSPVLPHYKLFNIERPNSFYGTKNGPGSKHLLDRLVLDKFDKCVTSNDFTLFPKTIIFVKHLDDGIDLNCLLTYRYKNIPNNVRPWAFVHSQKKEVSMQHIQNCCNNDSVKIIITTPKLLMGVNLSKFYQVIMLGPYGMMADLTQALGRAGRREEGGRGLSILYNCWNNIDISQHVSDDVKEFCKTKLCLKSFMHKYYTNEDLCFGGDWCCNNC